MKPRTYYGIDIHYNAEPGYRLKWWAFTPSGQVSADTLDGIKQLIRQSLGKEGRR